MDLQWTTYTDIWIETGRIQRCQRAVIPSTPALDELHTRVTGEGWQRRDVKPHVHAVCFTTLTGAAQPPTYSVGGQVVYVNGQDGCLLYVTLAAKEQATVEQAIASSTVRVAGVRWPEAQTLAQGKGMKARQKETAQTMMDRYGALLDDQAWVQVPYWTRGGRGGYITKIAVRDFKAGELRSPQPAQRRSLYCRLSGMFLNYRGEWVGGRATVYPAKSPGKVRIGLSALDVERTHSVVELRNPVLDKVVWRFPADEFARLEAKVQGAAS